MLGFTQDAGQQVEQPLVVMILMRYLRAVSLNRTFCRIVIVMVMIDGMVYLVRRLIVMAMRNQFMRQAHRIRKEQKKRYDYFSVPHDAAI